MNTSVDINPTVHASHKATSDAGRDFQLSPGAGLALAVLLGSVSWMGIFALLM